MAEGDCRQPSGFVIDLFKALTGRIPSFRFFNESTSWLSTLDDLLLLQQEAHEVSQLHFIERLADIRWHG